MAVQSVSGTVYPSQMAASGAEMQLIVCLITSDLLVALYARSLLPKQNMDADDMLVI